MSISQLIKGENIVQRPGLSIAESLGEWVKKSMHMQLCQNKVERHWYPRQNASLFSCEFYPDFYLEGSVELNRKHT